MTVAWYEEELTIARAVNQNRAEAIEDLTVERDILQARLAQARELLDEIACNIDGSMTAMPWQQTRRYVDVDIDHDTAHEIREWLAIRDTP